MDATTFSTFSVNMLFTVLGNSGWQPILDYYDAQSALRAPGPLPTATSGAPVISELAVAFYYSSAVTTAVDTDAAQTTQIATDVTALSNAVATVQTGVTGLQTTVAGLQTSVGTGLTQLQTTLAGLGNQLNALSTTDFTSLQSSVNAAVSQITQTNTSLMALQNALQGSLANLQVTSSQVTPGPRSVWLLQTVYGGQLVDGVVTNVTAVVVTNHGTTTQNLSAMATILPIAPGILQVTINAHLRNVEALQFSVQYQVDSNLMANGSVITPYIRGDGDQ